MKQDKVQKKGHATVDDIIIGQNLKRIRNVRNISQEKLAGHIGVTFQQLQKYEKGKNRISASNLLKFSDILEVNVYDFYSGLKYQEKDTLYNKVNNPKVLQIALLLDKIEDKNLLKQIKDIVELMTDKMD